MPNPKSLRRAGWVTAVTVAALVAGGCDGGEEEPLASPTPSKSSWRPGEYTSERNVCRAISPATLKQLGIEDASPGGGCSWRANDPGTHADTRLELRQRIFPPPEPRPDYSATDEAQHEFQSLARRWSGATIKGLGDEAGIVRTFTSAMWTHRVQIAVRVRNVIVQVITEDSAIEERYRAGVPPLGVLEAGALGAAREAVAELDRTRAYRVPAAPGFQRGEVTKPRKVCGSVKAAGRLVAGGDERDLSPRASELGRGCIWQKEHGDTTDHLVVNVEVVPPSPATGQTGTQIAQSFSLWQAKEARGDIGDNAVVRRFASGNLHDVTVTARRGNLLISVGYQRWSGPPVEDMRKDAVEVAKELLADYR